MAAILNSAIMNSAILQKKKFTHSIWLNLMMAAILNSAILVSDTAILDSDTLFSSLRFTQKHSPCTLTLTQPNSIWLKLIHSDSTWWWQPSSTLPSWIQPFCTKLWLNLIQSDSKSFILTQLDEGSHPELCHVGFSHCHHSFWFRWWQPLISAILDLPKTLSLHSGIWLNLIQSSNSDVTGNHLTPILPSWIQPMLHIWLKLMHSDSTWWWQPSWISLSWIQPS